MSNTSSLLCSLITFGDINMIKYFIETHFRDKKECKYIRYAIEYGYLDIVKYLRQEEFDWSKCEFDLALVKKNLDMIEYLFLEGCPHEIESTRVVINVDVLSLLHRLGIPLVASMMNAANSFNRYKSLEYLLDNDCPMYKDITIYGSAPLDLIRKMRSRGIVWSVDAMVNALDDLEKVKYLYENGYIGDRVSFREAVIKGNVEIVKFLYEKGCPYSRKSKPRINNHNMEAYLHDNKIYDFPECETNHCILCYNQKSKECEELWIMESENHDNMIQWLPREMLEDTMSIMRELYPKRYIVSFIEGSSSNYITRLMKG